MEGIESMSGKFDEILQRALKRETEKVREEILKEGRMEGEADGLRKAAKSMLEDGSIPIPKIAEFSGLTIGEVESIKNSLQA